MTGSRASACPGNHVGPEPWRTYDHTRLVDDTATNRSVTPHPLLRTEQRAPGGAGVKDHGRYAVGPNAA